MLAALGMFVFDMDNGLFDELARRRAWRHAHTDRLNAKPASQYLGPGEDAITLTGSLIPGLAGKYSSITRLAEMADTGEAFPLADGTGTIIGSFVIEGLEETHKSLIDNGKARWIDFTLSLIGVA